MIRRWKAITSTCTTAGKRFSVITVMRAASFQLPFSFAFAGESRFSSFRCEPDNHPLLHHLQHLQRAPGRLTWLWGVEGSGKTHLLQALGQQHPEAIYLPMHKLLGYEPDCLAGLHASEFLIVDDLHLVCGKREWEEQLFAVCNELLRHEGYLVCAAAAPPGRLAFALADLQSRLQLAQIYEVHELSDAGKASALVERAQQRGIELKDEAVNFILARNQRNMHDLSEVLDRLDQQALAEQRRITIPFIKSCMGW